MCLERGCGFFVAMGSEVVQNHCGAGRDFGDQHLADICSECRTVHCSLDDPGGNEGVVGQACDEGLRTPAAKRCVHRQTFAAWGPPAQAGEIGFDRCFVKKYNAFRHARYGGQVVGEPVFASLSYIGSAALGGNQRLFLCVKPRRLSR